jgi:hypothetical protein
VLELNGLLDQDVLIPGTFGSPSSITAAGWVNPTGGYTELISIGDGVFDIRIDDPNNNGKVVAFYFDGSQYHAAVSSQSLLNTGWHHVAASFNDTTKEITLYIDGVATASTTGVGSIAYSGNSYIGSNSGATLHYNGRIDDVRVFDRLLTPEQIAGLASDSADDHQSIAINVLPVNDPPQIDGLHSDLLQVENDGSSKTIDVAVPVAIADIDNADFDNGFLRITGGGFDTSDQLEIVPGPVTLSSGVADGSVVSVSGVAIGSISGVSQVSFQVDFNSDARVARVEALLNAAAISSTSTDYGYRTVNFILNDGDGGNDSATADVVVVSSIPGTITTQEDVDYVFSAADFSIAGAVGSDLREVTFAVLPSAGTLSISGVPVALNQSVSKSSIDAGELIYRPAANDNGSAISDIRFFVNSGKHAITVLAGSPNEFTVGMSSLSGTNEILGDISNF